MTDLGYGIPPIPPPKLTRFSTVPEVADALRVSRMTVYRLINNGILPSYKFGRAAVRIPTAAVWDYMRGQLVDPLKLDKEKPL